MTAPAPVPQLAKKWIVTVTDSGGSTFTPVKGLTNVQLGLDYTQQDQTDYDSGLWSGGQYTTQIAWSVTGTAFRKLYAGAEDAGQKILREAAVPVGEAQPKQVDIQVYDRNGGEEAYQGTVTVQWQPQGGSPTDLETVNFTLSGVGERLTIPNPGTGATATGATAGTPGSFTPGGSSAPANLAALSTVTASPATAWTTGQYVVTGDSVHAHWTGSAWATGDAP